MSSREPVRLHAIYAALGDAALFRASVTSIYDSVDRITVTTTHDRDWLGEPRSPSGITALVLSREIDPDRKIDLIVGAESNEARARNRAMDHAAPQRKSRKVKRQHQRDEPLVSPDYFLVIDEDEIYEQGALDRLRAYAAQERRPFYRVPCVRYFKRWNYRVTGLEWMVALVRADQRIPYLRLRKTSLPRRALARVPGMPGRARTRLRGFVDVSPEIGMFHHGSYVGPRARIEAKLGSFGHRDEIQDRWLEDVYDRWTVETRDFNPAYPGLFARAEWVGTEQLPSEIAMAPWPADYLEVPRGR